MEQLPDQLNPVRDLNKHRTCDISDDRKTIIILLKGCLTIITANADGTLNTDFKLLAA